MSYVTVPADSPVVDESSSLPQALVIRMIAATIPKTDRIVEFISRSLPLVVTAGGLPSHSTCAIGGPYNIWTASRRR